MNFFIEFIRVLNISYLKFFLQLLPGVSFSFSFINLKMGCLILKSFIIILFMALLLCFLLFLHQNFLLLSPFLLFFFQNFHSPFIFLLSLPLFLIFFHLIFIERLLIIEYHSQSIQTVNKLLKIEIFTIGRHFLKNPQNCILYNFVFFTLETIYFFSVTVNLKSFRNMKNLSIVMCSFSYSKR